MPTGPRNHAQLTMQVQDSMLMLAGQVPPSVSAYLALLTALPALHTCALQLLQTLLQAAGGSFVPHLASCSHLLANLLRQIAASAELGASSAAAGVRQQVGRSCRGSSYLYHAFVSSVCHVPTHLLAIPFPAELGRLCVPRVCVGACSMAPTLHGCSQDRSASL